MKKLIIALVAMVYAIAINAKTLVDYYSYTFNVEQSSLQSGIYIINQGGKSTKIKL